MAKTRSEKISAHGAIVDRLNRMQSAVLVGYSGLSVKDVTELRNSLRTSGIDMVVTKKTVLQRALKDVKLDDEPIKAVDGEIAMVFGFDDEVTGAKLLAGFAKTHDSLVLKGAYVNGTFIDGAGAKALAKLPSRDELRGRVVWIIGSPISGLVSVLGGTIRGFVNVVNARKDQLASQPA